MKWAMIGLIFALIALTGCEVLLSMTDEERHLLDKNRLEAKCLELTTDAYQKSIVDLLAIVSKDGYIQIGLGDNQSIVLVPYTG